MERDINEGVTNSIMALTTQNSHGKVKQTVMENINPNFMEEITPRVMREINPDNKELPNGKELNRKEKNVGEHAEEFINVPIMYVSNMGNLGINSQSETLAPHNSEGKSHAPPQAPQPKTPKWTKIARVDLANTTPPTGTIETGKKRSYEGEAHDGSRKKSRATAKNVEIKTVEAKNQPHRA